MADSEGKLTGLVTDEMNGVPLPGAQIQILGAEAHTVTGKDGRYTLSLAPGDYMVKASLLGWLTLSHHVVVTADQTATQDFGLMTSAIARDGL